MVRLNPFRKSKGNVSIIKSVSDHIETHFGKIAWVMHEKESPLVHIDVYVVRATKDGNHQYLVTSGMSEKPMPVPAEASDGRYAELILGLPADWPLSTEAFQDESNYWPVRLLKGLARYAHENNTWLYAGHSMYWSNPPEAFASNTRMTSVLLLSPKLIPEESHIIHVRKNKHIRLWGVFPLYQEELELKMRDSSYKLDELFDRNGITELLDPNRPSIAPLM
jgi:hypothetical protein